ncbi:LacI family DNA-binding transcriptional regulator [Microbacterium sp. QXD-8]|uniref:LacI family DNA-binding transcriptional regulator n=1 Tax=Microbacterium psychrotolerans TaxID=3068321 RepID=A0ABU0Z3R5_9MICO|nr:LacI family DNA-binding transcriptional regulator [Microbacterium sp. QXD-8]MDQ7879219.1 LacI family DNA-binding transcriptional regulator [Microbacterium sp. QXD-8]
MARTQRVTLKEIAAQTGVSLTTISKVLNGAADVSSATRALVEEQLRMSGYRRRKSKERREYIEVVLHELDGDWALAVIEGVRESAAEVGLAISLSVSGDRRTPGPEWLDAVVRRGPTGIILLFADVPPQGRATLKARGIPFVIIDPAGDPAPGIPSVGSANWSGGLAATRHLLELGHRRIAAITGPEEVMSSLARLDGYRAAMTSAGVAIEPEWIRYGDFQREGGERHASELLSLADPPTAIFAGNDLQALGVLYAAQARGIAVPGELSVVGYDDLAIAELASPRLTTVHQPLREMAEQATKLLLQLLDEPRPEVTRVELATSLVVRDSTAAPAR